MNTLILADIDTIMDIYLNKPVLGNAEIMRLFNCKGGSALRLKKEAQQLMNERGELNYSKYTVNTETAFKAWHIDIRNIEKRYTKKQKLRERRLIS